MLDIGDFKHNLDQGPSNDHSHIVWFNSSMIAEKILKYFP
jgi:hypothetical protein